MLSLIASKGEYTNAAQSSKLTIGDRRRLLEARVVGQRAPVISGVRAPVVFFTNAVMCIQYGQDLQSRIDSGADIGFATSQRKAKEL
jgi:hypothetical protein